MKIKIIFFAVLITCSLSAQSVLTLDAGTTMGVFSGADRCANTINGSGVIYGGGTVCGGIVAVEPVLTNEIPESFGISQNYPNPFNPVTTIKYQLPVLSKVNITVYDILGRVSAVLIDSRQAAGYYSVTFDAGDLSSGIYICKIEAGSFVKSMKMSVIK